jgi:hypothetical protein
MTRLSDEERPEHRCCSGCDASGHCSHGDPAEKARLAQALRDGDMATFTAAVRKVNRPAPRKVIR